MHISLKVIRLAPVIALLTLAACGSNGDGGKPASQVLAKVNDGEISVHQLNQVLSRSPDLVPERMREASAAALEQLIDQELMVQQAMEDKLHRDPKVLQALESARREVLARAYVERASNDRGMPTEDEVRAFYEENPGLFAKRRIYNLQELKVRLPPERMDDLRRWVADHPALEQLATRLNEEDLPFVASASIKPAEQLPLQLVATLVSEDGPTVAVSPAPDGAVVVIVGGYREAPVDETKARPFIEQHLARQKRTELARAEVKRLREEASIAYVGEFKGPGAVAAGGSEMTPARADVSAGTGADTSGDDTAVRAAVERGVSSLR